MGRIQRPGLDGGSESGKSPPSGAIFATAEMKEPKQERQLEIVLAISKYTDTRCVRRI